MRDRRKWALAVSVCLAVLAAACGDSGETTRPTAGTSPPPAETTPPVEPTGGPPATASTTTREGATTTTREEATTTTREEAATTTATAPEVDDVVAAGTFDFASGADPQVRVTVSVGTNPGDPSGFDPAGFGLSPAVTAPEYWVLFAVENRDNLGVITSFELSGSGGGPLGADLCPDVVPLGPEAAVTCIAGPFPTLSGDQTVGFTVTASGERQRSGDQFLTPPITRPAYLGAPTSFVLAFETGGDPDGLVVSGAAGGSTVDVGLPELTATVSVDCADPGDGAPLRLVGYVIITYDAAGNETGGCESLPTIALPYTLDGLSDTELHYTGG